MSEAIQQFRYLSHPVEVLEQKVRNYLLNVNHSVGGPKAKFFLAKGFSNVEWQIFANAIKLHPIDNPIQDEEATDFGLKVRIVCKLKTPDASDPCILTVWMVEGTRVPRLVRIIKLEELALASPSQTEGSRIGSRGTPPASRNHRGA